MLQRHKLEVGELHHRPHHPILLQRIEVRALQLLLRITALHESHATQEHKQVCACENALVGGDTGQDLEVGPGRNADAALQEGEPQRRGGTEDAAAVQCHATGTLEFVAAEAFALDELLCHCVARGE